MGNFEPKKANANLQQQLTQANVVIDRQANSPTIEESVYGSTVPTVQDTAAVNVQKKGFSLSTSETRVAINKFATDQAIYLLF